MNRVKPIIFMIITIGLASVALASELTVDKDHSHVGFKVKHILGKVPGEFKDFEGTITFDPKKPESSATKITIQAASINTNNEKRDTHLKSGDFFDVVK